MKVLIFSGGTGSIALQTGFSKFYKELVDVQILTNCYDNGKSTGAVRQVFDGKILGPSDLRKNQSVQYSLKPDANDKILNFLNLRFDCKNDETYEYCINKIESLCMDNEISQYYEELFLDSIKEFFNQPKSKQITYQDFSLSNIIYAGLSAKNNYSLSAAGKIMEGFLGLNPDSVIINDDTSLFLRAIAENGQHILDEGEIVEWNNPNNKIKNVYFVNEHGKPKNPILNQKSIDAITSADIIIFSTGTQWSSLIPTYLSSDLKIRSLLEKSTAKKYIVINNKQDEDMKGCDVNYLLNLLDNFLPMESITKIFNKNADEDMTLDKVLDKTNCFEFLLSNHPNNKEPNINKTHFSSVSINIMGLYYENFIKNKNIVFDYDDTLVGRNNEFREESIFNLTTVDYIKSLGKDVYIFTGNYIKSLDFNLLKNFYKNKYFLSFQDMFVQDERIKKYIIYADGGANLYNVEIDSITFNLDIKFIKTIDDDVLFSNTEVDNLLNAIELAELDTSKVQNRNNATISIKPVENEYRKSICKLLNIITNNVYNIRPLGRTTIDISKFKNNKQLSFDHLSSILNNNEKITYIGDESYIGGNDNILLNNDRVNYLHVNNPSETTIFLLTLIYLDHLNRINNV